MLLHAPTPLVLADLTSLTRAVAAEVRAGLHAVVVDPNRRWYQLLRSDAFVDVWLISWATEQSAELHDHAGSLGALTVVSGALTEQHWIGTGLATRRLTAGSSAGFPLGHVHDVGNADPTPAVSVHAYSPPLSAMSYYAVDDAGLLRRTRSELVELGRPADRR
ncbi:Cysteine dioxygenase type I [Pseudonocardia thermophila]|uniref:Cysteine dioxygenase type I n=1 Tax=Pseudonocardia thermophila TaxID=1848 RepID=A0A1M6YMZ2_PSETH|nr:cysteine dioxygenase family protein [Pseudonocardia thermophila]SHL19465.1 Cysteine dioxygenase type I [Pseudonocardia thermophila]